MASRRAAEKMIVAGRVRVDGRVVRELGTKVDGGKNKVEVDGHRVEVEPEFIYLVLNKPKSYVSSRHDKYGRKTVYDLLSPDTRKKVWSVGRLDYETEGLLIFTNDGDLTQKLTHPSFEHSKEYEVLLDKKLTDNDRELLEQGVDIGGYITAPATATVLGGKKISLVIHEGRKRQVRRMLASLGYLVLKLTRVGEANLQLSSLRLKTEIGRASCRERV